MILAFIIIIQYFYSTYRFRRFSSTRIGDDVCNTFVENSSIFSLFGVKLSNEDIADFEVLRDVAMATIFGFL